MAKKSETKSVVPAQQKSNLPTAPWRDLVRSNTAAALVRGVGASEVGSLSFRGGVITYKGEQLGHSMDVVVLDALAARHYYAGAYQPDTVTSPDCYSFDGIAPHPEAQDKQHTDCAGCPLNQFGSASNAKGKACKEGYKLALINAIAVEKGKIETAEIATAKLSITASKGFAKIAAAFAARYDGILFGAILRMEVKAHPTNQYQIEWTVVEELAPDVIDQLGARYADAHKLLTAPYPKNEDRPVTAKPRGKGPVRRTKY